jgi:hypothetical protein
MFHPLLYSRYFISGHSLSLLYWSHHIHFEDRSGRKDSGRISFFFLKIQSHHFEIFLYFNSVCLNKITCVVKVYIETQKKGCLCLRVVRLDYIC